MKSKKVHFIKTDRLPPFFVYASFAYLKPLVIAINKYNDLFYVMQWIARGILLLHIFVLLIGSVGINVFRHTCEEDGTMTSYFLNLENHCSEEAEDLPSCCEKSHDEDGKQGIKKDCCSDAFSYLHYQPLTEFQSDKEVAKEMASGILEPVFHSHARLLPRKAGLDDIKSAKPPPGPIKKYGVNLLIQHGILRL